MPTSWFTTYPAGLALLPAMLAVTAWKLGGRIHQSAPNTPPRSQGWQTLEWLCAAVIAVSHVEIAWRYTHTAVWTASSYHRWALFAQSAMVLWIMLHSWRAAQWAMQSLTARPEVLCKAFASAALRFAAVYWSLVCVLYLVFALLLASSNSAFDHLSPLPYLYWLVPGWGGSVPMPGVHDSGLVTAYSLWPLPVVAMSYLAVPALWALRKPKGSLVALAICGSLCIALLAPTIPALAYLIAGLGFLLGLRKQGNAHPKLARLFSSRVAPTCAAILFSLTLAYAPASIYQVIPVLILGMCFLLISHSLYPAPCMDNQRQHKLPYGVTILCFHGPAIFLTLLANR